MVSNAGIAHTSQTTCTYDTAKCGGINNVPDPIQTLEDVVSSSLVSITPTDASSDHTVAVLDIVTYAILAAAGSLSLLFVVALACTILTCCVIKFKRKVRLDVQHYLVRNK